MLEQSVPGSLRHRQLKHLLVQAKERQAAFQRLRQNTKCLEKQALIDEGLLHSDEVEELRDATEVPAHLHKVAVERRFEMAQKERETEQQNAKKQLEESFKNPWLRSKERETFQLQREMEISPKNSAMWQNYRSLIELNSYKIRMYHEKAGCKHQMQHAIACRRQMLLELELISSTQEHLITRLDDIPPILQGENDSGIFATPTSEPSISKPLDDYSDPAAWGGLQVEKRNYSQSQTRRAKKPRCTAQASGQKYILHFFKN